MTLDDFCSYFDAVDVLDREVSLKDIVLHIDEADDAWSAPTKGCMRGCFQFWCLCRGPLLYFFPHRSTADTVELGFWETNFPSIFGRTDPDAV